MEHTSTEAGLERMVLFSDATVAIAITLLILPLVDVATDIRTQPLREVLGDNRNLLAGFVISFVVIGRLWMGHHRVFERVAGYDALLMWLNLAWLLCIVFLPFSANLLSNLDTIEDSAVFGFYIGTILAATLAMVAIEAHLVHHPVLLREGAPPLDILSGVVLASLMLVALVVAVLVPVINMFALLLLLLLRPITRLVRSLERRRSAPPSNA